MRHVWRNRISWETTKLKKDPNSWNIVTHKQIANYFALYSQVVQFENYILVAHRDMISTYMMTGTGEMKWQTTHSRALK